MRISKDITGARAFPRGDAQHDRREAVRSGLRLPLSGADKAKEASSKENEKKTTEGGNTTESRNSQRGNLDGTEYGVGGHNGKKENQRVVSTGDEVERTEGQRDGQRVQTVL